jgi:hypothetical protein
VQLVSCADSGPFSLPAPLPSIVQRRNVELAPPPPNDPDSVQAGTSAKSQRTLRDSPANPRLRCQGAERAPIAGCDYALLRVAGPGRAFDDPHVVDRSIHSSVGARGLRLLQTAAACVALLAACAPKHDEENVFSWDDAATPTEIPQVFEVPPPPFTPGVFPCSECHNADSLPSNPKRRRLKMAHTEVELHHDEKNRWCLDCHDADDRDKLHLASGLKIPFEESYRLCGQCHGDKYRDWRAGVHGRRVGEWDGHKSYLLCVHCHNSHAPHFAPIEPKPPPHRPERTP